ncbi:MAG TPA: hypothetical protein PK530_24410, partial [Anaerolineales bacterium]|nr:hypothetical protein [Anaerolineales bacterium]
MRFQRVASLLVVLALILVIRASTLPAPAEAAPTVPQSTTTRISVAADGAEAEGASYTPAFSSDGTRVAFISDAENLTTDPISGTRQVFVKELASGAVTLASVSTAGVPGDGDADAPALSSDGGQVVFESYATNLISGTVNSWLDVFVHDTTTLTTTQISVASDGTPGNSTSENPALSADGRYVVFQSNAYNL